MIFLIISLIFKGFAVGIFLFSWYFFYIHWSVLFERVDDGLMEKETWFWFSISFSRHSWEPPHIIPMTCLCRPHSSQQDDGWFTPSQCLMMRKAGCPSQRSMGCPPVSPPAAYRLVLECLLPAFGITVLKTVTFHGMQWTQPESKMSSLWLSFNQEGTQRPYPNQEFIGQRPDPPLPQKHSLQPAGKCCREEQHWGLTQSPSCLQSR